MRTAPVRVTDATAEHNLAVRALATFRILHHHPVRPISPTWFWPQEFGIADL